MLSPPCTGHSPESGPTRAQATVGARLGPCAITLQELRPDDVTPEYVGWLQDPETTKWTEARHARHTLESTREYVAKAWIDPLVTLLGVFANGTHVGNVRLSRMEHYPTAEIGLLIGPEFQGQGLGPKAIVQASALAFGLGTVCKLWAGIYAENTPSLRAFARAGYAREAFHRHHYGPHHIIEVGLCATSKGLAEGRTLTGA